MRGRIPFIDSHTGGEPTRLILSGGPDLGSGPLADRAEVFRSRHDRFRAAVIEEPRGSDVFVGALLCEPSDATHSAGVIFFNNVGLLGMCGHGLIGVIVSLCDLGRISPGVHRVETPVGVVEATLGEDRRVAIANVPSYRFRRGVEVQVPGYGALEGEIAWGGNWFFLVPAPVGLPLQLDRVRDLIEVTEQIRGALESAGIVGPDGAEIDHIELYAPSPTGPGARTFVLCPGLAWDRSPCGTGTSAKMACLAADGILGPGDTWRQESIVGSVFEGSFETRGDDGIQPTIRGTAHVMSEGMLRFEVDDPFRYGLRS